MAALRGKIGCCYILLIFVTFDADLFLYVQALPASEGISVLEMPNPIKYTGYGGTNLRGESCNKKVGFYLFTEPDS